MGKHCAICQKPKSSFHSFGFRFVEVKDPSESEMKKAGKAALAVVTGISYKRGIWLCKVCYDMASSKGIIG